MTGFGQATDSSDRYRITVTLRSVNHRYLDLSLRLPDAHRDKEAGLRQLLGEGVARGRVEARVEIEALDAKRVRVVLDRDLVEALHHAVAEMAEAGQLEAGLRLRDVARFPGALRVELPPTDWSEEDQRLLERVLGEALEALTEARTREGERLASTLQARLEALGEVVRQLVARRRKAQEELYSRLQKRLNDLLAEGGFPQDRLVQEAALLADRSDVQEELDRLSAHLEGFRELLAEPGALGKRLDFLTQEMLRELNTLLAKCRNMAMTGAALDGKMLCDQIREQVQNLE